MKHVKIFAQFFGRKEGQTLAAFGKEIKELSPEERDELAILAAAELGTTYEHPEKETV